MTAASFEGWVPIRLYWREGEPWVDWCYLGPRLLTGSFFEGDIFSALELPFNSLFRHQTPISALAEWQSISPGMKPTALVFHSSRCGSTLVSQLLAALPQTVVLSESPPVDVLARSSSRSPDATVERRAAWLQWMVSALGQPRVGGERHYFIKFEPRTTLELPLLRFAFPDVPWVFVYRNPVEVLISLLNEPSPLTTPGFIIPDPLGLDLVELMATPPDEYAARMLGRLTEAAVRHHDGMCTLVNYTQLPEILWSGLDRQFGITLSPEDLEAMRRRCGFHTKYPNQPFHSDTERRKQEAGDRVRLLAEQWVMPHYRKLEEMRQGSST
jgi:hypothetical protein